MGKIKDMPSKRAFVTLTFMFLIVATLISVLSFWGFEVIRVRLEKYIDSMNSIQRLEDADISLVEVKTHDFIKRIESTRSSRKNREGYSP